MDLLSRIASFLAPNATATAKFLAPKVTAAGSAGKNTLGMLKDYLEYNSARDPQGKQKQLIEYNQKRNAANEALKQFGFDAGKQGNQFDPVKYGTGTLAGAGELASFASPMGGGLKARAAVNALPGVTDAIGRGENIQNTILSGLTTAAAGTGGEKLIKGSGILTKAAGNKIIDGAENLGLRKLGLTKLDVNKFMKETGESVNSVLKRNNLIGQGAENIDGAIKPLQDSFNTIVEKSGLNVNENELLDTFAKKIDELKTSNAPEIKQKGQRLEEYVTNLFENPKTDFSGKGITNERRMIDQIVKDFQKSGDAVSASTNRIIRDTLQDAVRETSEKAGVKGVGNKTLTELGRELKKLYKLEEVAMKRTPQPTGAPLGLYKILAGGAGVGPGFMMGGLPGAIAGGAIGLGAEQAFNNPKSLQKIIETSKVGGNVMENLGEKLGSDQMKKVFQILGISGGRSVNNLVSGAVNEEPENKQTNSQSSKLQNDQNSQLNLNNPSIAQNTQSQDQIDPNMEITLTDGTKTTYGQLQQQGAFQQQEQPQDIMGGFDEEKLNQLALMALLTGDTKALNQIQAFQGIQEKMNPKEKELNSTTENRVQLANSGLRALDSIEQMIQSDPSKVLKSNIYGKLGARDYDSAAFRAVEGLLRARSGAAIPETEVRRYMDANLPKIGDSQQEIQFKLEAFRKDLQDIAASGGGTSQEQILMQMLNLQ
jgi:hypothetical protein